MKIYIVIAFTLIGISCQNQREVIIDKQIEVKHKFDSVTGKLEIASSILETMQGIYDTQRGNPNISIDSILKLREKVLQQEDSVNKLTEQKNILSGRYDSLELELKKYKK